jgi:hypothetical protein
MAKQGASRLPAMLAEARGLGGRMAAATETLNANLRELEAALTALQLGVTATVLMNDPDADGFLRYLSFGKDNRDWKLLILTTEFGRVEDDAPVESSPLLNCSRAIRLKAVDNLPALVERLIAKATSEIEEVEAQAKKAAAFSREVIDSIVGPKS